MIINGTLYEIKEVVAKYGYWIEIISKDERYKLVLNFKPEHSDIKNIELNKRINLKDDLYWDNSLSDGSDYHVFDTSNNDIYLTRVDENKFRLEVLINSIDLIYETISNGLESIEIDTEFEFDYNYVPEPDYEILKRGNKIHTQEELNDVLDKM